MTPALSKRSAIFDQCPATCVMPAPCRHPPSRASDAIELGYDPARSIRLPGEGRGPVARQSWQADRDLPTLSHLAPGLRRGGAYRSLVQTLAERCRRSRRRCPGLEQALRNLRHPGPVPGSPAPRPHGSTLGGCRDNPGMTNAAKQRARPSRERPAVGTARRVTPPRPQPKMKSAALICAAVSDPPGSSSRMENFAPVELTTFTDTSPLDRSVAKTVPLPPPER